MPEWLKYLIENHTGVVALVTVVGAVVITPFLGFLAKLFVRVTPPKSPVAYDVRDVPEHPLLVSAKVHLADDEMAIIRAVAVGQAEIKGQMDEIEKHVDHANDQLQLLQDRLSLLMSQRSR